MAASTAAISTPFFQNVAVVRLERGLYVCAQHARGACRAPSAAEGPLSTLCLHLEETHD